jgi:heme oxygenase (biliverdin-IX-beta and delta-forming)
MLHNGAQDDTPRSVLDRLRSATRSDHAALEDRLDLLRPPLSRARFAQALQIFHAFHAAWEPRVADLLADEALLAPRRRLHLLVADLQALGEAVQPYPPIPLAFLDGPAAAWGSLYVMEGSTLGGQLIAKALRDDASWVGPEGLSYFNPHGRRTAVMWRGFCAALEAQVAALDPDRMIAGARATFRTLAERFPLALEQAA